MYMHINICAHSCTYMCIHACDPIIDTHIFRLLIKHLELCNVSDLPFTSTHSQVLHIELSTDCPSPFSILQNHSCRLQPSAPSRSFFLCSLYAILSPILALCPVSRHQP